MRKRLCICLCVLLLFGLTGSASAAGEVTDTLTVKVGYFGMPESDYVEIATYHWSELSNNVPLNECAYSFFRQDPSGNYSIVIDSARGFYITDLVDYANVYAGDIQSIQFYTRDQAVGSFVSMDYAELFETERYYFDDLAAYVHPTAYNDIGNVTEYTLDSEAWNHRSAVRPMLALEDSWISYELGTEHTAPNFEVGMNAGNRFRLLFGQSSPTENRANQTAKYTHTIYITLRGAPEIKDTLPELKNTVGSHTVTFDVSIGNEALLNALSSLLQFSSSDTSVLEFTGFTVTPSSEYSDIATVTASYTVHRAGSASVSIGFSGTKITDTPEITTTDSTQKPPETDPASDPSDTPDDKPNQNPGTKPSSKPTNKPTGSNTQTPSSGRPQESTGSNNQPSAGTTQQSAALGDQTAAETGETAPALDASAYRLSADLAAQLQQQGGTAASREEPLEELPPQTDVTALTVTPKSNRVYLLGTGAGSVALCILGAFASKIYYKKGR